MNENNTVMHEPIFLDYPMQTEGKSANGPKRNLIGKQLSASFP